MKPMLAAAATLEDLRFPLLAQPKIDGVRCLIRNGCAYSRSGKLLPNRDLQRAVKGVTAPLDGELIADSFSETTSIVMSHDKDIIDLSYAVFDLTTDGGFSQRYEALKEAFIQRWPLNLYLVETKWVRNVDEASALIASYCEDYEGAIFRDPTSPYKNGRSTLKQQYLLKVKPFEDDEGVVVGYAALERNHNPAFKDELGHTKRSTEKAGKVRDEMLGALQLSWHGTSFCVGTGFTLEMRRELWRHKEDLIGRVVKFKYLKVGMKEKPRHPVFLGFRSAIDT